MSYAVSVEIPCVLSNLSEDEQYSHPDRCCLRNLPKQKYKLIYFLNRLSCFMLLDPRKLKKPRLEINHILAPQVLHHYYETTFRNTFERLT